MLAVQRLLAPGLEKVLKALETTRSGDVGQKQKRTFRNEKRNSEADTKDVCHRCAFTHTVRPFGMSLFFTNHSKKSGLYSHDGHVVLVPHSYRPSFLQRVGQWVQ